MNDSATDLEREPEEMRCPTCAASQAWSAECRRCKSDLSDLWAVWRAARRATRSCLLALRERDLDAALRHAETCRSLRPGEQADRLTAVCHLLRGQWREAVRIAARYPLDDDSPQAGWTPSPRTVAANPVSSSHDVAGNRLGPG